jgi:tetratricopeptide (TPR) repeat protein
MGVKSTPARWGWLLLIGSRDGRLYAFDARHFESEPVWTVATRHQVHGPPVVDERLGQTCFGSLDETVYAVDRGGCIRWQQRLGGQIMGGLALDGGRLFVGATDHKLYALNAATGQPLWEPIVTGDWIVATPAVWRGLLIFGSNDGHLYMADAAQGKILWRFPAGGAVQAQPAVTTEGLVVVGTSAGAIYGLPWHLRNYVDAATWLEGQRGGEAEAGELWLRAGNQDRAFACLRHAAAWARLAEAAEGAGRYGEAAHAYEQLAASRSGTPDVLAGAYRQAAQMWDTDSRPGEALRCRRESARLRHAPLLVLEPQPLPPLYLGDHTTLSICLRNEGTSAAHGILVQATGHLRTQRRIETPPLLPGGERLLTIDDIEPGQSGTAQVIFMAEYYDANGRVEEAAKAVLRLQVLHRPVQEFHYHGDHVEGDKITGDKVEGDQVKIERKSAGL